MLITEILNRNARCCGNETALIERNPAQDIRKEITWEQFNIEANRIGNALMSRGIRKGDKVIHLMMNCIEWLPIYFGILRTGAWAVRSISGFQERISASARRLQRQRR